MTNDAIKELSNEIVKKIDDIKNKVQDVELKKRLDDIYYELRNIENIALTQNQLTNEKEQENMNLKKEIEIIKYSLDFAMDKDKSEAQEVLENQATQEMNQENKEEPEMQENDSFGVRGILSNMNDETRELKGIISESSRELDDIYLDTLKIANNVDQQKKVMTQKEIENTKLKNEVTKLQLALDFATGKVNESVIKEQAQAEMNTELTERKFDTEQQELEKHEEEMKSRFI